ncbi:MAG: glycosyltransferase [Phycisphaera sp.]|nr:glycosyltransferase [Phycisphaera sp.]
MSQWWVHILTAVALAWALQGMVSAYSVRRMVRRVVQPRREDYARYRPFAHVVLPVKGLDTDLRACVDSLCEQDYPGYRLVFVVESEDDPAYKVLVEQTSRDTGHEVRVVVAGQSPGDTGQKVHNMLTALKETGLVEGDGYEDDVVVFADADAVPGRSWLASIVGPLTDDKTGCTTGYRWMVPPPERPTVASHLLSVMNSSVVSFLWRKRLIRAWGGAMALRCQTLRKGGLVGYWTGAISDDFQLSRMCRSLGLRVYFVPECLVPATVDVTFKSLWAFARRQYLITRVHAPVIYFAALAALALYVVGFTVSWGVVIAWAAGCFTHTLAGVCATGAVVLHVLFDQYRATHRARLVRASLGAEVEKSLHATLRYDRWATPVWMTLHGLIVLGALFGSTIAWRSIRYRLRGPQRVERL